MSYELECLLTATFATVSFVLGLFLGLYVNKWFALFIVGIPLALIVFGLRNRHEEDI